MKKLTTVFAVLAFFACTSAFAYSGGKVSTEVSEAFTKNFKNAKNVIWEIAEDHYFARFELDGKTVDAAFAENGNLVGISRVLQINEIPLNVSNSLKTLYSDYAISKNVTEVVYNGNTFYYASAVGKNKILKLKCLAGGEIYIEKKTKK